MPRQSSRPAPQQRRARSARAAERSSRPASYSLDRLLAFTREETARADQKDEDDRREQERGQVLTLVGWQRTSEQPGGEADREPAEGRGHEPVHAAEHDAGENEDRAPRTE